jgi:hypothetical protein
LELKDLHPTEVARQLALVSKQIFDKISPSEYVSKKWIQSPSDKTKSQAPNIIRMVAEFNRISNWAASEVLKVSNPQERALILNRLIIIAEVHPFSPLLFNFAHVCIYLFLFIRNLTH